MIFEYKRSSSENVINQGLFYLDWLLDHKADFKLLVIEKLGMEVADQIDWSVPCVILYCKMIFTKIRRACSESDAEEYQVGEISEIWGRSVAV